MAVLGEVPVLVPLEVADVVLAQQGVDPVEDVLPGFRVHQVDDVLVPPLQRQPSAVLVGGRGGADDPVRVGAGDVGVEVDHFRFHPQAELHAPGGDGLDEGSQSVRPQGLVHVPVAQAGFVVAAAAEPAVVQDEALHSEVGGGVSELDQGAEVVVEVHGLPGVEHHGARFSACPAAGSTWCGRERNQL